MWSPKSPFDFGGPPFCYRASVDRTLKVITGLVLVVVGYSPAAEKEWADQVPSEQRARLAKRLTAYVEANRSLDWNKLYDLISDSGHGGVDRPGFSAKMTAAHRKEFANAPDLLKFQPALTYKESGYDIYGCAKAKREGMEFNGVALIHAVFEHNDWFFSGWAFTEFPNEPCKSLSDPKWEKPDPMEWSLPLEELRSPNGGIPIHVDSPKR